MKVCPNLSPCVLMLSAVLFALPPDATADLFDDCSKGSQKACQEIDRQAEQNKTALERLGRRAEAFRTQIQRLGLQSGGVPNLRKAYGPVLQDYLVSDAVMASHVQKMPEGGLVSACADHFYELWIGQRKEWPKAQTGEPDWVAIYMQILDHYFRFCRHQVR